MDVRCEKCMTVYEFDDSKVGEQGVTVKCTQCGNLFKVKRRERTAELALGAVAARSPAYVPPAANVPSTQRTTVPGIPMISKQPTRTPQPTPTAQPHIEPGGWMIRVRSGEIYRFRELTTLQQWIVERKVTRDDEISRSGDQWKRLGGIAELASFFHIVEQAAAVARADGPQAAAAAASAAYSRNRDDDDPALVTTAPMAREPSGPIAMGNPIADDDPAFARTNPTPKLTPAGSMPVVDDDADDTLLDDEFAGHPRRRAGVWAGVLAALVLVGAGGYLAAFKRDAVLGLFAHKDARASEAYRQGREYFLLDSDDAFRNAAAAYERGHEADDKSALPLAGLAETMTSWAAYLRDDAHGLEMGAPSVTAASAAKTLRRDSQAHLDEAKKYAQDALALDSESPEVNRAMADYLRVDGAPAAEVERYLTRATAKAPSDAESAYVGGALAFREGNLDAAKTKLTQANTLNQAATQHTLLRASYLLARIALQTGDKAGAKTLLQSVLAANANHDRARALLATFDADTAPAPVAAQTPTPPPTPAAATAPSGKPATPPSGAAASGVAQSGAASKAEESNDYGKLIAQGDHLSENGHAKEARKLYDRALSVRPSGLEAIMGLGYCDLDGEKFSSAVDHFKRALALSPSYGDAIIGLAEAYKLRGDRHEALTWYKQYLSSQPNGPKATMAKNNIRDLEPRGATAPDPSSPAPPTTPPTTPPPAASPDEPKAPATATAKPPEEAKKPDATPDTTKDEPKKADDDKPVQLPRPPTSDEPPP
ncbi:MAG TPA: tetratricopeptide repeat protein [Polyangia bacterium]|nr:tetratricopeptide repeat protein [Polyangia bacterium]